MWKNYSSILVAAVTIFMLVVQLFLLNHNPQVAIVRGSIPSPQAVALTRKNQRPPAPKVSETPVKPQLQASVSGAPVYIESLLFPGSAIGVLPEKVAISPCSE